VFEELEVGVSYRCHKCNEPLGENPGWNCIGEMVRLPSGLEVYYVYHKTCAPRHLIHEQIRQMARWN
jgi:hypothetical protein